MSRYPNYIVWLYVVEQFSRESGYPDSLSDPNRKIQSGNLARPQCIVYLQIISSFSFFRSKRCPRLNKTFLPGSKRKVEKAFLLEVSFPVCVEALYWCWKQNTLAYWQSGFFQVDTGVAAAITVTSDTKTGIRPGPDFKLRRPLSTKMKCGIRIMWQENAAKW